MNKHIELVKKWLANPESVTKEELEKNRVAANDTFDTAYTVTTALNAAKAACNDTAKDAAYWVKRYEELKEQRERAIDENIASGKKWNSKPTKIDFDQSFMSAEYYPGYNEGYKDALREAAICLLVVGAIIMVFN